MRLEDIMIYNYLIHMPLYKVEDKLYMNKFAKIDFDLHMRLLPKEIKIRLIAPLVNYIIEGSEQVEGNFLFQPLKYVDSFREGFKYYFYNKKILRNILKKGDILHSGGGGYPYFMSSQFSGCKIAYNKGLKSIFVMDCDLIGKLWEDQVKTSKNPLKKFFWIIFIFISEFNYRKGINLATTVFLLGQGVYDRYSKYTRNPFRIYQPIIGEKDIIPYEKFENKIEKTLKSNRIKLFFLGRLAYEKGVDLAIGELIKIEGELYEYRVIGSGVEEEKLRRIANKNILFSGRIDWGEELFYLLDEGNIFFVSHRTEEMTRSVFDAMARGNAILAVGNKTISKLVKEGQNGLVIDTYKELRDILIKLKHDKKLLIKWMRNSRDFVFKYNNESCIKMRLEKIERDGFYEDTSSNAIFSKYNGTDN